MANRKEEYDTRINNDTSSRLLLGSSDSPNPLVVRVNGNELTDASVVQPFISNDDYVVKDKFYLVYMIFLLFGIASLLPWNIFITATSYFVDYKLNTTESYNSTYRNDFTFYVGVVGQTTNVIMNLINILVTFGGNPKNRIPYTFILCSLVIIFHVILAIVDSSAWPLTFFILCCVSVFVMYIATGIMNSCIYYLASLFPMEYVNAIILGNNLAGIFTTTMSIVSKSTSPNLRIAAIYYFLSAFVILMLGFVGYFGMHRTDFYNYHNNKFESNSQKNELSNEEKTPVPYMKILKKIWLLLFCIWLNFFTTLMMFPVYLLGVEKAKDSFIIPDKWFQDVVTFLTFNVLVTIGNMIPKIVRRPGPKWIPVPVIIRAVLVVLFFSVCNFKPKERRHIPVLITNDYIYWIGCALSPLSFGYFTSLLMMYTPGQVPSEHSGSAAMIAALVLTIGVTTGLQFSKIFEFIVLA
jgi:equilibrative nucleoside transporter 1/2/3